MNAFFLAVSSLRTCSQAQVSTKTITVFPPGYCSSIISDRLKMGFVAEGARPVFYDSLDAADTSVGDGNSAISWRNPHLNISCIDRCKAYVREFIHPPK